jgi:hypothetical protein
MPQTVEAIYHDGVVELKEKPAGIQKARALVVFLDSEEPEERHKIDWNRVRNSKSIVDKWIVFLKAWISETGKPKDEITSRRNTSEIYSSASHTRMDTTIPTHFNQYRRT